MKKFVSILLGAACLLGAGLFAGCGEGTQDYSDDPNVLHISMWEGGYGIQWMEDLADAYEAKNENIDVKIDHTTLRDKANIPLTNVSVYDIVITDSYQVAKYALSPQYSGYDSTFVDLSDVMNHTPAGESLPIREKFSENVMEWMDLDGKVYYTTVAASLWGLTYNPGLLAQFGYDHAPRTTQEMKDMFDKIAGENTDVKPLIFSGSTDYWNPIVYTWWAQYDGVQSFNSFFKGQTLDGEYLYDIFATDGRRKGVEWAETFLKWGSGYYDQDAVGYQYKPAQLKYLQGDAVFMANGGWLENEMSSAFTSAEMANIANMRVPVISDITAKFDADSDKSDTKLREIVSWIDGGKTGAKPSGVSDGDLKIVEDARSLTYLTGAEMTAVVPVTSKKADLAKDFLKFMYSDEGAKVVLLSDAGMQLPLKTDFSADEDVLAVLSDFGTSRMEILSSGTMFFRSFKEPIVSSGGLAPYAIGRTFEKAFASPYENDRISAGEYYQYDIDYYTANNGSAWRNLLRTAGLID